MGSEMCIRDRSRKELDRELGDSRALHLESFVPTSARQKSVQACLQKVIDQWSEVPEGVTDLPEVIGLRDALRSAQLGDDYAF